MKTSRTNNVKRFCNFMKIPRPMYVDPMAGGYRVPLGYRSKSYIKQLERKLKSNNIPFVEIRKRRRKDGFWDIIIPYSYEKTVLEYDIK